MENKIFLFCFILLSITLVNADLGTFNPGTCVNIKTILNSTYVNISTLSYPNTTLALNNKAMTKQAYTFNYTFCNTTSLGIYTYDYYDDQGNVYVNTFKIGFDLSLGEILIYVFFLMICLIITYFSFILFKNNKYSNSEIKYSELYKIKQRNEFLYYIEVLKKKLWIVGVFGIYLSLLVFIALLEQLIYSLGLTDISKFLIYGVIGFTYGLVPFMLFWIIWFIFTIYKVTTETMRWQFGRLKENK